MWAICSYIYVGGMVLALHDGEHLLVANGHGDEQ
jgi:hypothetical protein